MIERLISRENGVIVGCILAAFAILLALERVVGSLPTWAATAGILGIGVIVPVVINEFLDSRTGE